jgi:integrase
VNHARKWFLGVQRPDLRCRLCHHRLHRARGGRHGLRKAYACRLIDAGVGVADAAAITGHLDLKELMEYAAARDKRIGAARGIAALG